MHDLYFVVLCISHHLVLSARCISSMTMGGSLKPPVWSSLSRHSPNSLLLILSDYEKEKKKKKIKSIQKQISGKISSHDPYLLLLFSHSILLSFSLLLAAITSLQLPA